MQKTANKQWLINDEADPQLVKSLAHQLNVDEVIAKLLVTRGISNFEEAKRFFRPSLDDLHDPFLMKDMEKAVTRLAKAIECNEKVLVYGDYDVDGTTSVAMMITFLKDVLTDIDFYVPNRFTEGYGISEKGVQFAFENGFSLIIALDCGIKAFKNVIAAKEKGIDFIICDHHTSDQKIPNAAAVLDPKRFDCEYPCKHLTGCGVGFKLIQAFAQHQKIPFEKIIPLLDFVAVSIASDIVPIIGENRILANFGLKILANTPRLGFRKIKQYADLNDSISISDIVFKIGPRINASGRIESASHSVRLLISESKIETDEIGKKLEGQNKYRKNLDQEITREAIEMVNNSSKLHDTKAIVVYKKNWNKGVLGIVASRLCEKFYRPAIVLAHSEGKISGSARSIIGFNIYQAILSCEEFLENYGGHKYAAGLTLMEHKLNSFTEKFLSFANENIDEEQLIPKIKADAKINLEDITPKFWRIIEQIKPFGPHNMNPLFITDNIIDYGSSRTVGKNNEHLKLVLTSFDSATEIKNGIAFSMSQYYDQIAKGNPFSICYSLQENNFWGKKDMQLVIRDLKLK